MQEKNTNNPGDKKQGEWPETGKQGGQSDVGKRAAGDSGIGWPAATSGKAARATL